jgi:hypothetical protein
MYCTGKVHQRIALHLPLSRRGTATRFCQPTEMAMFSSKSLVTLSLAFTLGVLGAASGAAADHGNRSNRGGFVMPGSLDGVNPAYHPDIFGNAAVAHSYGFVQSRDGTWHVLRDWR